MEAKRPKIKKISQRLQVVFHMQQVKQPGSDLQLNTSHDVTESYYLTARFYVSDVFFSELHPCSCASVKIAKVNVANTNELVHDMHAPHQR